MRTPRPARGACWRLTFLLLCATAAAQNRDNVLLIVADDLGVDAVRAYREGANPPPTPTLDALAARGVLFRNAYSNPLCSPTRATIFTGRYSFRTGVGFVVYPESTYALRVSEHTLPEILDAASYRQALIGKWHLGNRHNGGELSPNVAGWSHFAGMNEGGTFDYRFWPKGVNGVVSYTTRYATTDIVDSALEWITGAQEPWACAVCLTAPHVPLHAPPSHLHGQRLRGDPLANPRLFFRAMVEAMDTEIGRLLASLGPERLRRTNVVFVADNGTDQLVSEPPFLGSHAKFTLYEGGVNVPLIVAGPVVQSPGRESTALVNTTDLFATIGELAGVDVRAIVPPEVPLDSISIVPYLRRADLPPLRATAYSEQFGAIVGDNGVAIRNASHKLIRALRNGVEVDELYDLVADPFESTDLLRQVLSAADERHYNALALELARLRSRAAWVPFGAGCRGSGEAPLLAAVRGVRPRVGDAFTVRLSRLSGNARGAVGLLGDAATSRDLGALGMPDCRQLVVPGVLLALDPPGSSIDWTIRIPDDGALLGRGFFQQCVIVEPGANQAGLVVSNGGEGVVGVY